MLGLRDLRCVFAATIASNLGDGVVAIALAWAVLDLTHSATDLGVVLATRIVAQILVVLFAGVIADRVSRRRVMMAADLVRLVGQAVIGVLLVTGAASLAELIISQVLLGGAGAFFQPASSGLLPMLAGDRVQEANAMRSIAAAASSVIGPLLGALVVVTIGGAWGLVADSASYGLSALFLSRLSRGAGDALVPREERASMLVDLRDGFREVASRTWAWTLILAFAFANSLATTWDVFGPLATRRWYGGAPAYALLTVMWAGGSLLGGVLMLRFRPRRPLLVGVLVCIPGVLPTILLALRCPLGIVAPLQLLAGIGGIACNTMWWTALAQNVPEQALSRFTAYDYAGSYLLMPLGTAIAGPLATGIGLRSAMLATNIVALAVMVLPLLVPDVRRLRAAPAPVDIVSA